MFLFLFLLQTNIPVFQKSQFSVKRRFSDFLGLHDKLVARHKSNGVVVPKAPEKSAMGEILLCLFNCELVYL